MRGDHSAARECRLSAKGISRIIRQLAGAVQPFGDHQHVGDGDRLVILAVRAPFASAKRSSAALNRAVASGRGECCQYHQATRTYAGVRTVRPEAQSF